MSANKFKYEDESVKSRWRMNDGGETKVETPRIRIRVRMRMKVRIRFKIRTRGNMRIRVRIQGNMKISM